MNANSASSDLGSAGASPAGDGAPAVAQLKSVSKVRTDPKLLQLTAQLLQLLVPGKRKLLSFELGPMTAQVFGDVAIVQASVTEKRIHDGKDNSGQFVFMNLLKRRENKWVIVRTLGTKVI